MEIDSGSGNKNAHPTSTQQGRGCTPVAPRLNVVSGGEPRLSAKMGVYFSRRNGTRLGPLASSLNMGARAERTSRADGWAFLFPEPVLQNGGEGVNPVANVSCLFPWSLLPQGGRLPAPTETGRGGRGTPAVKKPSTTPARALPSRYARWHRYPRVPSLPAWTCRQEKTSTSHGAACSVALVEWHHLTAVLTLR